MNNIHQEAQRIWGKLSIFEQMANIGAEVGRAIKWRKKGKVELARKALSRALELLDFTINDNKNYLKRKELLTVKEALIDDFLGRNTYHSTDEQWEKYFFPLALVARKNR